MRVIHSILFMGFVAFLAQPSAWAGSFLSQTPEELVGLADGIFIGKIESAEGYLADDGSIRTRFVVRPEESIKGSFPVSVWVNIPGGAYQGKGVYQSSHTHLGIWESALLFVEETEYGLSLISGSYGGTNLSAFETYPDSLVSFISDVKTFSSNETSSNSFIKYAPTSHTEMSVTDNGLSGTDAQGNGGRRFQRQDRGDPIPVIYDDSLLPNGISSGQARVALEHALAAWEAVTSLKFTIVGNETFPQSVNSYDDGTREILRIQFHDKFDNIGGSTLGVGGNNFFTEPGAGGTVKGLEFVELSRAHVILAHDSSSMENPITFEEVLTHEIGHAIGLAHSSESQFEANPLLKESIMYFQAAADGRGAQLNEYDINTVTQSYPTDNIPPFAISKKIAVVTTSSSFSDSRINLFEIGGGDSDNDSITIEIVDDSNGDFQVDGTNVRYVRAGAFLDNETSGDSYFLQFLYRVSDGVNKSGFGALKVVKIRLDNGTDGLPDSWTTQYFGTNDTSNNRGPFDDFDNDGVYNYYEFRADTDPTQVDASFNFTSVASDGFSFVGNTGEIYLLESSSNLTTWNLTSYTIIPTNNSEGQFITEPENNSTQYFRIRRLD